MPDNNESLLGTVLGVLLVLFLCSGITITLYYLAQNGYWELR